MKYALLLLVGLYSISGYALSNNSYYSQDDQSEFDAGALKDADLIYRIKSAANRNHRSLGYSKRAKKELYGFVDLKTDAEGDYIYEVYCRRTVRRLGRGKRPNNNDVNTEHTWPQSLGAKAEPKRGDLHHLFPTDSKANSVRSSLPFGEVIGKDAHSNCSASQRGTMINPKTGKKGTARAFQPPPEHRGNVARAMFYFASKYGFSLDRNQEYYLRKWHNDDPVDDSEIGRNDRIQKVQGNRNPYIDYPRLVDRITDF
jgi:deoxyribonuclease-1